MKVKKYVASTMPEAMKRIRQELGDEAVILNSKEIESGGFLGFFTKRSIEVIAAIDTLPTIQRTSPKQTPPKPMKSNSAASGVTRHMPKDKPVAEKANEGLVNEIQELKKMIATMSGQHETSSKEYPEPFQAIHDELENQEVLPAIRMDIMKHLLKRWYNSTEIEQTQENAKMWLKEYMISIFSAVDMSGIRYKKKFINIVGPTGVGKTTTIAKIAAHSVLNQHKKVALITTDTFRIAAVEQLKTYAKILNIPLEVAYSIDDFKKAKQQFEHYDLVLIDSAGRNFRNKLYVEELQKVIDFSEEMESFLVLALTSKYRDMATIYHQFSFIPISKLIFTKMDETGFFGSMLNMVAKEQIGIAYVTTGQNVPEDILEATPTMLTNILLEVETDERSS